MVFIEDLATPRWHCVRFAEAAAEWPPRQDFTARGIELLDLDASRLGGERELLGELAQVFHFPDYFGENWDALDECLRDLAWMPARGYVLRLAGAQELWQRLPRAAGKLIEAWLFAAGAWADRGVSFHLVFLWSAPAGG